MAELDPVKHWITQIDRMLEKRRFSSKHEALRDIKNTIEETERVTPNQITAIKNMKWGRNRIGHL